MGFFRGIARAFSRIFTALGLMAEKATETSGINEAVVERGIRDSKAKADKAHYANGQLQGQIILLRDQVKRGERQEQEMTLMLTAAANANDDANGASYAEQLATVQTDLTDNRNQLSQLEDLYKQNTEIIANSLREIQKFERDFQQLKVRVRIGESMSNLSQLIKSSTQELGGMMGGDMAQSMQQLREKAAGGEGQMRATLDLTKAMGSDAARRQDMRRMQGKALFEEFKRAKLGQPAVVATDAAKPVTDRQKVAE